MEITSAVSQDHTGSAVSAGSQKTAVANPVATVPRTRAKAAAPQSSLLGSSCSAPKHSPPMNAAEPFAARK